MNGIPDSNNFYAIVPGTDPMTLAEALGAQGWRIGKASWHEYEVVCGWADLTFMPDDGVLVAGAVASGRYADAVAAFTRAGFPCLADPAQA